MKTEDIYIHFLQNPVICTDTRNLLPDSLFFCLTGDSFDGNTFAEYAVKNGAKYAIIDNPEYSHVKNTILVENCLKTLQALASFHRSKLNIPIIGITGTNGKTTTKELIATVLEKKYNTVATPGNLNNHIGVPLSVLRIKKETEIAVIEMGANHLGEIAELCEIARPNYGIITNIGKAHLEGFGSIDNIIKTKTALYKSVYNSTGKLFVNSDNNILVTNSNNIDRILYGSQSGNYCFASLISSNPFVKIKWENEIISTNLTGSYNFENILAAICIGKYFGINNDDICNSLSEYKPSNMRSQYIKSQYNDIILDAYNANPSSMKAALKDFGSYEAENKIVILGDMLELGSDKEKEHSEILSLLKNYNFNKVFLVGEIFSNECSKYNYKCFPNSETLKQYLTKNPIVKSNIFIKGSRGIKLEMIKDIL